MDWLTSWPLQFAVAWPIAFCVTMVAWPASMKLSGAVMTQRRAEAAATAPAQTADGEETLEMAGTR